MRVINTLLNLVLFISCWSCNSNTESQSVDSSAIEPKNEENTSIAFTPVAERDVLYANGQFDVFIIKADNALNKAMTIFENKDKLSEAQIYESLVRDKNCFWLTASVVDDNCMPLGLFINNGIKKNGINLRKGQGNFYMGPTGYLSIDAEGASIEDPKKYNDTLHPNFAIQSGPLLIKKGLINPRFDPSSKNLTFRSAVGFYKKENSSFLVFVKSNNEVSFHSLASILKEKYKCTDAMTLECGPIVSGFLPNVNYTPRQDIIACNYIKIALE